MAACDPQTLVTATRCLVQAMSAIQLEAAWACIAPTPPPPSDTNRILEDGATRATEDGTTRIIE